jgi:hypothetical protein
LPSVTPDLIRGPRCFRQRRKKEAGPRVKPGGDEKVGDRGGGPVAPGEGSAFAAPDYFVIPAYAGDPVLPPYLEFPLSRE